MFSGALASAERVAYVLPAQRERWREELLLAALLAQFVLLPVSAENARELQRSGLFQTPPAGLVVKEQPPLVVHALATAQRVAVPRRVLQAEKIGAVAADCVHARSPH